MASVSSFAKLFVLRSLALLLLTLNMFLLAYAQSEDGKEAVRGFPPNGSYALSDIESISLSSGNLNYSIPIASLPASRGGRLKPSVYLLYNSKRFDTQVRMCLGLNCSFTYIQTDLTNSGFGGWRYSTNYFIFTKNRAANYVDGAPPPPYNTYKYKTMLYFPDGSGHQLRPSNQAQTEEYYSVSPGSTGTTRTYYTTDGTYLRVEFSADGASWTIYFPDGTTVNYNSATDTQLTTDGNGNFYTTQNVTLPNGNPATVVTDQLNRTITVERPFGAPHYVRVNGFGGTELVTQVNWAFKNAQGKKYLWKHFLGDDIYVYKTSVPSNNVVTSINLPNGQSYQFQYNSEIFDPLNPTKSVGWGELYRATLPTGAIVQYSYSMDNRHGDEDMDIIEPGALLRSYATSKQLQYTDTYDDVSTQRTDTWSYSLNIIEGGSGEGQTASASVIGPDGAMTSEQFFVNLTGSTTFGKAGLSYKTVRPDGSKVERIWQENTPYNGSGNTKNFYVKTEFISIRDAGGTLVKTAIQDYVYDKNGNVVQVTEYDWVPYNDVVRDGDGNPTGAIPGSAQPKRVIANGFYNQTPTANSGAYHSAIYNLSTAPNLRQATQWTETRSQSLTLARVEFDYDNPSTSGNVTAQRVWDSLKGPYSNPLTPGNSNSVSTQYNSYGSPTLSTDARNSQTQVSYGAVGGFTDLYPTQVKTAYQTTIQRTESREYDFSTGLVTRMTDVDNNVTTSSTYDVFGRPTLIKAAEGNVAETRTATEYSDALRRVIVRSDLNTVGDAKLVSISHYDELGRVRLTRQLEDSATESATDEHTGIKVQTRYLFSGANTYQVVSNPYRATTSGSAGSEQSMGWRRTKLDISGRVVEVQTFGGTALPFPWGSSTRSSGTVTTTYDANFATVADQLGKLRRSMVDGLGRLERVDEPDASNNLGSTSSPVQPTNYTYDPLGNLVTVVQGSQTRYFMYDSLSRLIRARNAEQGTWGGLNLYDPITGNSAWSTGYAYDANGNLTQKTDPLGVQSIYAYDDLNRNTTVNYTNTTSNPDVVRYYDNSINYGKGRYWHDYFYKDDGSIDHQAVDGYDALGRVWVRRQVFHSGGQWYHYESRRTYDLAGNVKSQQYPSGRVVNYDYDTAGRTSNVSGNVGDGTTRTYASNFSYTPSGQLQEERFATSTPLYHKLHYNTRLQLYDIRLSTVSWSADHLNWDRGCLAMYYDSAYNWGAGGGLDTGPDNNGNVTRTQHWIPEPGGTFGTTDHILTYDSLNRLTLTTEWFQTGAGYTQQSAQAYSYDRWGNRTINAALTWGTGINNKVFSVDSATNRLGVPSGQSGTMTFDGAGNLIFDSYSGEGDRVYDAENRMTKAWANSQWQTYAYDADGNRARRKVNGTETWQVYGAGGEVLVEYAAGGSAGSPQKEYVYRGGEVLVTAEPSANLHWLVPDHLGTPRMIADLSGSLAGIRRHDYLPFGEELGVGVGGRTVARGYGGGDGVRQKFTQKERDIETGLDYFINRYYSSMQGRFTSPDAPFADQWEEEPQSWNLYSYVANQPLNHTDPFGLWKEVECSSGKGQCWVSDNKKDTITSLAKILGVDASQLNRFLQNPTVKLGQAFDISGFWSWRAGIMTPPPAVVLVDLVDESEIPGDKYSIEINIGPRFPIRNIGKRAAQKLWNERGKIAQQLTKEDNRLLREFFGQGKLGKLKDLKDFKIPQGLTKQALERYGEVARRAVESGNDKSGVQRDRLELIERALKTLKD